MTYISAVPIEQVDAIFAANAARRVGLDQVIVLAEDETDTPGDYITIHGQVLWVDPATKTYSA